MRLSTIMRRFLVFIPSQSALLLTLLIGKSYGATHTSYPKSFVWTRVTSFNPLPYWTALPNCGNTVKARTRTMMGAKMFLMTCGGGGMLGTQGTQPELQNVIYIEWSKHWNHWNAFFLRFKIFRTDAKSVPFCNSVPGGRPRTICESFPIRAVRHSQVPQPTCYFRKRVTD